MRVGWRLISHRQLRSDQGEMISLFTTCPWDVKLRLREVIRRAQVRQILEVTPEASGDEQVWGRALRLRALICGQVWPTARKHQHGLVANPMCESGCDADGAFGHQWHEYKN
eukprot:4254781-Pyramimonas_sp.AAC.1